MVSDCCCLLSPLCAATPTEPEVVVRKYLEELKGTPADEVRGEEEEKMVTKGLACPESSSLGCAVKTEVVPEDRPGHPWCCCLWWHHQHLVERPRGFLKPACGNWWLVPIRGCDKGSTVWVTGSPDRASLLLSELAVGCGVEQGPVCALKP